MLKHRLKKEDNMATPDRGSSSSSSEPPSTGKYWTPDFFGTAGVLQGEENLESDNEENDKTTTAPSGGLQSGGLQSGAGISPTPAPGGASGAWPLRKGS